MTVELGPLRDDEKEALSALWQAADLTRPWNDPLDDIARCRNSPRAEILVGRDGDEIVSSVMVGDDGHRGTVYYVAVAPERRGEGLGRQAMRAAEQWLVERGVVKLNLLIRESNETAHHFYAALGYEKEPRLCMARWLDESKKPAAERD